jgi:hypothetical protein
MTAFEERLVEAVRRRSPGDSALHAFRRLLVDGLRLESEEAAALIHRAAVVMRDSAPLQGTSVEMGMFSTLASYGYVGGVLDLRVDSDADTSTALWQLPRVRIGLGDTVAGLARWFRDQGV